MSFRPQYLAHVNLYVRDAEATGAWYKDLLGLHTYHHMPGKAVFLSADENQSHEIAVMSLGPDAPLPQKGQVGLNHLAFRVASLDDLKEFYARMKAKGVAVERIGDHGISLGIYFRDPDGNGVEVYYELPREEWPQQDNVFAVEGGRFPGPWDEVKAKAA